MKNLPVKGQAPPLQYDDCTASDPDVCENLTTMRRLSYA